jgi:hypothetical protein
MPLQCRVIRHSRVAVCVFCLRTIYKSINGYIYTLGMRTLNTKKVKNNKRGHICAQGCRRFHRAPGRRGRAQLTTKQRARAWQRMRNARAHCSGRG